MAEFLVTLIVLLVALAAGAWVTDVAWPAVSQWQLRRATAGHQDDWLAESNARPLFSISMMVERVARRLRQTICGFHGHDQLLHFEPRRLSLECASCGHKSPGWDVRARIDIAGPPYGSPSVYLSTPLRRAPRAS